MQRYNTDFVRDAFAAMQADGTDDSDKITQPITSMDSIQRSLNLPPNILFLHCFILSFIISYYNRYLYYYSIIIYYFYTTYQQKLIIHDT